MANEYFIISLKWSVGENHIVFWRPEAAGYTIDIDQAGRYTQEQLDRDPRYYDDGKNTLAVPCAEIEPLACRVVSDSKLHGEDGILKRHGADWQKVLVAKGQG